MKKILLVLMLIFLGHSAFAMYCWEERSGSYNYESKMAAKLGASNIVKVSSILKSPSAIHLNCTPLNIPDGYGSSTDYRQAKCTKINEMTNLELHGLTNNYADSIIITNSNSSGVVINLTGITAGNIFYRWESRNFSDTNYAFKEGFILNKFDYWDNTTETNKWYFGGELLRLQNPYYVHTFCTTVGGGGGAAGAAVNYIIKAD